MEKELLIGLLKGFYVQGDFGLAWSFQEDCTIGETLGKGLEDKLLAYIKEHNIELQN